MIDYLLLFTIWFFSNLGWIKIFVFLFVVFFHVFIFAFVVVLVFGLFVVEFTGVVENSSWDQSFSDEVADFVVSFEREK